MQDAGSTAPDVCPVCSTRVEGERLAGIWTGSGREKAHRSGPGYTAVCQKCGADLYSLPTREEAGAREFFWEVREPGAKQYPNEKAEREALLKPLLQARAERTQVMRSLELEFKDYSEGSISRPELQKWLFFDEVNDAAARFPGIFFHLSHDTMTWLFFDTENKLQGYFVRRA